MSDSESSFWKRNGLTLVLVACMLASLFGQIVMGRAVYNDERGELGAAPVEWLAYLESGHFVSATFENWESEFLQMGVYVLLAVSLRQKGSAESRPLRKAEEAERIEPGPKPWPTRAGGLWKALYGRSLAIAFALLFVVSFGLHLAGSWRNENAERLLKGEPAVSLIYYAKGTEFWFESFQNWQSEFLAVASLVLLTIWLRQKDSPQSKSLEAPHSQTGT